MRNSALQARLRETQKALRKGEPIKKQDADEYVTKVGGAIMWDIAGGNRGVPGEDYQVVGDDDE